MQYVDLGPGRHGVRRDAGVVAGVVVRHGVHLQPAGELRRAQRGPRGDPAPGAAAVRAAATAPRIHLGVQKALNVRVLFGHSRSDGS